MCKAYLHHTESELAAQLGLQLKLHIEIQPNRQLGRLLSPTTTTATLLRYWRQSVAIAGVDSGNVGQ